jgi:WD40 repeat protein
LTDDPHAWDEGGSWSPDGSKIVFEKSDRTTFDSDIYVMNADGTGQSNITQNADNLEISPDWSPNGQRIAFVRIFCIPDCSIYKIYSMNADGTGQTDLGSGEEPSWSPDGRKIVYSWTGGIRCTAGGMSLMNADGSGDTSLTWNSCESLTFDTADDWQPLPGYARPQGAARLRVPLTVAYAQCGDDESPNRTHGPSLAHPSCNPHVRASDWLTLGTVDANGFAAQGAGSVQLVVCPNGTTASGSCAAPAGMSAPDVRITVSIRDVRCRVGGPTQAGCEAGAFSDYVGELQGNGEIRITDRNSGTTAGGGSDPATVVDLPFPFAIDCVANPAGAAAWSVGGTCALDTHAEAVALGIVQPGKRMNVELGRIEVYDGGPDGFSPTADNTLFMTQGVFVP